MENIYVAGAQYFNKLPYEIKKIFIENQYLPTNDYDANNFIKSIYDVDGTKDLKVTLKKSLIVDGKKIDSINISSRDPFDAFVPQVWDSMTLSQKLNVVVMTFNYYCEKDSYLRKNKPKLFFVMSSCGESTKGFYAPKPDILYVSAYHLIVNQINYLELVSTLTHELTHKRQFHEIKMLKQKGVSYYDMNDYYKSLYFFRSENYIKKLNYWIFTWFDSNVNAEKKIPLEYFNEEQKKLLCDICCDKEKRLEWRVLMHLIYSNHPIEVGAQNNEMKNYYQIYEKRLEKYDLPLEFLRKTPAYDINHSYLSKKCYDFTAEGIKELEKLNTVLSNTNDDRLVLAGLRYLLDVMIEKRVTKPIDFVDYDYFIKMLLLKENLNDEQMVD